MIGLSKQNILEKPIKTFFRDVKAFTIKMLVQSVIERRKKIIEYSIFFPLWICI